jgi:ATP-dependent helicase/nuclease subunit B
MNRVTAKEEGNMLHLIVGIAHSKKSRLIYKNIEHLSAAGKSCILLVPEQASYINEKAMTKIGNPSQVSVVSFTRLSELLLMQLGGAKPVLDDVAAHMLMCVALQEVKDLLVLYRNKHKSRGFIAQIADFAAECKNAGITPETLSASAQRLPVGGLRDKASEAALILNAYEGLVAQSGMSLATPCRLRQQDCAMAMFLKTSMFSSMISAVSQHLSGR